MERKITIDVDKFKEILIYSWKILPREKQKELAEMGIHPEKERPT